HNKVIAAGIGFIAACTLFSAPAHAVEGEEQSGKVKKSFTAAELTYHRAERDALALMREYEASAGATCTVDTVSHFVPFMPRVFITIYHVTIDATCVRH